MESARKYDMVDCIGTKIDLWLSPAEISPPSWRDAESFMSFTTLIPTKQLQKQTVQLTHTCFSFFVSMKGERKEENWLFLSLLLY